MVVGDGDLVIQARHGPDGHHKFSEAGIQTVPLELRPECSRPSLECVCSHRAVLSARRVPYGLVLNKPVAGTRSSDHGLRVTVLPLTTPRMRGGQSPKRRMPRSVNDMLKDVGYFYHANQL